ncbi:MAG: protein-glutamate O-methyltransferase CheR [Myxococcales bacterium]|nr:protein-glutamate O-methyltransferase CheR [Myxococcales bacterium]
MAAPSVDLCDESRGLSAQAYDSIRELLHSVSGIKLGSGKQELVKSRVGRRLRALGVASFDEYVARLGHDREELGRMVDVLTTNKTFFFREPAHFDFIVDHGLPAWRRAGKRLRAWSAGCSTGEEPYSLCMVLAEKLGDFEAWDARILATDISPRVLDTARAGAYPKATLEGVSPAQRARFFEATDQGARVRPELRARVQFAQLNLLGHWPMRGPFDVIFCRNVMIYFDEPTRVRLVSRFRELLAPGGWLLIGHSESLGASPTGFRSVKPSTYARVD